MASQGLLYAPLVLQTAPDIAVVWMLWDDLILPSHGCGKQESGRTIVKIDTDVGHACVCVCVCVCACVCVCVS